MTQPLDESLENQFRPDYDDAGNVIGGTVNRSDADYLASMRLLREAAARFPLDEGDIVMFDAAPMRVTEVRDVDGAIVARMMTVDSPSPY